MRVPKLLLTVCAATVCAGFISIHAADTPAQAAARAALEQKMQELNGQTNSASAVTPAETAPVQAAPGAGNVQTPPPAETTAPAAAAASTPATETNTEVQATPTGSTSSTMSDTEAQAAAQAALEAKMRELDEQAAGQKQGGAVLVNSSGTVVVEAPATNQPATTMATSSEAPSATPPPASGSGLFEPASPTPPSAADQAAAQAALQQQMATLNQGQPAAPATPGAFASPSPTSTTAVGAAREQGYQPIVAPPLPISNSQEAQLQALNAKYMANQISPEEYFKQREAILAKP